MRSDVSGCNFSSSAPFRLPVACLVQTMPPGPSSTPGDPRLPNGGTEAEDGTAVDPWTTLSGRELRGNSIVFPAFKQLKLLDYVKCFESHGLAATSILSIQISSSSQCRVTFSERDIVTNICKHGFFLQGKHILPSPVDESLNTIQLHVHDVPIWVANAAVESALSGYGKVVGAIRHGKVRVRENVYVASGVRFATFKPIPGCTIPSYIKFRDGKGSFRVYHEGQEPTCRICSARGHMSRDCPRNINTDVSLSNSSTTTRPPTDNNKSTPPNTNHSTPDKPDDQEEESYLSAQTDPSRTDNEKETPLQDSARADRLLASAIASAPATVQEELRTPDITTDSGDSEDEFMEYHSKRKLRTRDRQSPESTPSNTSITAVKKRRKKRKKVDTPK